MNQFLAELASYIAKKENHFLNVVVLMPNRRSCLYLEEELSKRITAISWLPKIMSLKDWIASYSSVQVIDELPLIAQLFSTYKSIHHNADFQTFESFYFIGQIILNDFNDIDLELVNADNIFKNLLELKEIDNHWQLDEAFYKYLQKNYSLGDKIESAFNINKYLTFWNLLPELYNKYRTTLLNRKIAYEGLMYRNFIENDLGQINEIRQQRYYVVGFNALTKAEKQIFAFLKQNTDASFFWDYDEFYLYNEYASAGYFIKENLKEFPLPEDFNISFNNFINTKINIIATTNEVDQVKAACSYIQSNNNTAILLNDASALPVLVNSLPNNVEKINITMGFNIKHTLIYLLIRNIFKTKLSAKKINQQFWINQVHWLELIYHPLIYNLPGVQDKIKEIKKNEKQNYSALFVNLEQLTSDYKQEIITTITKIVTEENTRELLNLLKELFKNLEIAIKNNIIKTSDIEIEAIYKINNTILQYQSMIDYYDISLEDTALFIRLINQLLSRQKLDLFGEPLEGLQIMGIIESRLLDFDDVILLSMNEKIVPGDNYVPTFILYPLRKYFGLPTPEKREAIQAYHVYRSIQRAKNAYLFYSKYVGDEEDDMSPYLRQLRYNSNLMTNMVEYVTLIRSEKETREITVDKTKLGNVWDNFIIEIGKKGLSQSAIATFIQCPLAFYYQKVEKIDDYQILPDSAPEKVLGLVFHEIIKNLFIPYKDKIINREVLELIKKDIITKVNETVNKNFTYEFGDVLLLKQQLIHMLEKFIEIEKNNNEHLPFKILNIEEELSLSREINGYLIKIIGKPDMIFETINNNVIYIVDYKTGSPQSKTTTCDSVDDLFLQNEKYVYAFQLAFYKYLYYKSTENKINKEIIAEDIYIRDYKPLKQALGFKDKPIEDIQFISEFENKLESLLAKLLNKDEPFTQTTEKKHCENCIYNIMCRR